MNKENNEGAIHFLWNLAGFKKEIISECKVDKYHVLIISTLLILVGVYATMAWTFFFQTITDNMFFPILGGLFMGVFIVCFDRALIASLSSGKSNTLSLIFRLTLAIMLGVFLSQPMILKFYEPEINREAQIIADQKIQERKEELKKIYAYELENLKSEKLSYETQLKTKHQLLATAENDFKSEMDGSAGTERWGYNVVAKQKEKILERHKSEYIDMREQLVPQIQIAQNKISQINDKIASDIEDYQNSNQKFGTLIQAQALESLINKDESGTLKSRYYLLGFILTLLELSALIAKLLFKTPSYRSKVKKIEEVEVEMSEKIMVSELEMARQFFTQTEELNNQKLEEVINREWVQNDDELYSELWWKFKKKFIISD